MIDVPIPEQVRVGCYTYDIRLDGEYDQDLIARERRGEVIHPFCQIRIRSDMIEQNTVNTFIHELLHCIDMSCLNQEMPESQIAVLANALHEVLSNLGITFKRG